MGVFGSSYEQYDSVCKKDFGNDYSIADWTELESFYANGGNLSELVSQTGLIDASAIVSVNGDVSYSGSRDYFISYHNHNKPGNFLAHDNIDNYFISLGSWSGDRHVLCKKN